MADEEVGYGYQEETKQSPFVFGLNAGVTFLKKFEWIANGGKDGAEAEALDIKFEINGTERGYRLFPVTQAFDKQGQPITDRNSAEFKDAVKDFNAKITHILHTFQPVEVVKAGLSNPKTKTFKGFCEVAASILPKDYANIPLDIFMQYQWQIGGTANRTYLEVPRKMKYGKWLCKAMPGTWEEIRVENPDDNNQKALQYGKKETAILNVDGSVQKYTEFHLFTKNGWFMNSNFAKQQKDASASADDANTETGYTGGGEEGAATVEGSGDAPSNTPPVATQW